MSQSNTSNHLLSNSPIELSEEDLLNYRHYAEKIRVIIQKSVNNSNPLTLGIYGKWGEGKTSFLNLVRNQIDIFKKENGDKGIMKYNFNPWRYKTEDEMIFSFFEGLAQSMFLERESNLKKAGKHIKNFSRYLKAIKLSTSIGIPVGMLGTKLTFDPSVIFENLGEDLKGEEISLESFQKKIDKALEDSKWKIIVFIDDIDRLDKNEIYALLKIVKLNANFKNLVYLIPMDHEQVAKAIKDRYGECIEDGYKFLEKIINIPIHLPKIESIDLKLFFNIRLQEVFKSAIFNTELVDVKKLELEELVDNYSTDLFETPREIIRVLNSFCIGLYSIGEEVHIADLFWIEYIKIVNPNLYEKIKIYDVNSLSLGFSEINSESLLDEDILKTLKKKELNVLRIIFPEKPRTVFDTFSASLNERIGGNYRINSKEHFNRYFSYHLINKVVFSDFYKFRNMIVPVNLENSVHINPAEISTIIKDLVEKYGDRKTLYELESLISQESNTYYKFLLVEYILINRGHFNNRDKDIFAKTSRLELIGNLALILNGLIEEHNLRNLDSIVSLSEDLNYVELSHFTRKFKNDKIRTLLKDEILIKVKEFNESKEPFFMYPENVVNKMIMSIWKEKDSKEFDDYIKENINSKEQVGNLIRNFPGYWNGSYFGALTKENYEFMKTLVDVKFIYENVKKYYNIDEDTLDINSWDNRDERTVEQNVKEFLFHYLDDNRDRHMVPV